MSPQGESAPDRREVLKWLGATGAAPIITAPQALAQTNEPSEPDIADWMSTEIGNKRERERLVRGLIDEMKTRPQGGDDFVISESELGNGRKLYEFWKLLQPHFIVGFYAEVRLENGKEELVEAAVSLDRMTDASDFFKRNPARPNRMENFSSDRYRPEQFCFGVGWQLSNDSVFQAWFDIAMKGKKLQLRTPAVPTPDGIRHLPETSLSPEQLDIAKKAFKGTIEKIISKF